MRSLNISFLFLCLIFILGCEYADCRLKIINSTKKVKLFSLYITGHRIFEKDYYKIGCDKPDTLKWFFQPNDTVVWPIVNKKWEYLEKTDTVVIYMFDKLKFANYCKGTLPYDSCYRRFTYTKDDLQKISYEIHVKD